MLERVYHPKCLRLFQLKDDYEGKDNDDDGLLLVDEGIDQAIKEEPEDLEHEDHNPRQTDEQSYATCQIEEDAPRNKVQHGNLGEGPSQYVGAMRSPRENVNDRDGELSRNLNKRIQSNVKAFFHKEHQSDRQIEDGNVAPEDIQFEMGSGRSVVTAKDFGGKQDDVRRKTVQEMNDEIRCGTFLDKLEEIENKKSIGFL